MSVFESLYLVHTLQPWFTNRLKRLTKSPKLHFLDSGLLAAMRDVSPDVCLVLPWEVQQNRYALSRWIDANKVAKPTDQFSNYPSSKQVAFAERIARMKRSEVPQECFRDRTMMSKWIDANL